VVCSCPSVSARCSQNGQRGRARDVWRGAQLCKSLHLDRVHIGEVLRELCVEVAHELFRAVAFPPLRPAAFF
jgi:hypothetical protein